MQSFDYFQNAENQLTEVIPEADKWSDVIKVIDTNERDNNMLIHTNMNSFSQTGVCYIKKKE